MSRTALESVMLRGRFMAALSGGSTPRPMHRLLSEEPFASRIPWDKTHLFWVDERCVPTDDPASNYGAGLIDFIAKIPIPADHVHPMPTQLDPDAGAAAYQEELLRISGLQPPDIPVLDLICLGIGIDGHTASLFPGHAALSEAKRLVVPTRGGRPDVDRLTMTLPLINNAGHILFLISGREKADIVKHVLEGPAGVFPAQMIQPVRGNLTFLLDRDAASKMQGKAVHRS